MNHMQRSQLASLQGLPSSGSAFRGALAPQQRACSSPHVGRQIRSPGVSAGTAALSQLHRHRHLGPRHHYTALKAQPERSTEYSNSGLELDVEIRRTEEDIKAAEEEVKGAELAVQEIRDALGNVRAKLASTSSPVLSKKEKDALLMEQQVLLTELQYECMDLEQLRTKEQQLRTEEQQLREEKLKLTGKLGGPRTPDRDGTAMMARIRELKGEVPAPGEVLSFSGFTSSLLLDTKQNSVYIRGCYKPLFEELLELESEDVIITGTPGIGKSYFLYYLLTQLLALPEPPPYILWEHYGKRGVMWCYDHATGEVLLDTRNAFKEQLDERKAWYISDGLEPILIVKARIILLSPPCRARYKELQKWGAATLYMPLWELEELLDCRAKVFGSTVPEELATQLFERYGGVARDVLFMPSRQGTRDPAARLAKLEEVLIAALDACDIAKVGRGIGALEVGPEVSHRVVHIITEGQDNFGVSHLDLASKWVADAYFERAKASDISKLAELVDVTTGILRGVAHEQLEHQLLPKGGVYTIKPIDSMTLRSGKAEEGLRLPAASRVRRFQDVSGIMDDSGCLEEKVYYWPRSKNLPATDSLLCVGKTLHLFQMTVSSKDKRVSAAALTSLYTSLGATSERYEHLNLYYVVPPDVFESFELGAESWPPTDQQPDALRTHLYVLKGGERG